MQDFLLQGTTTRSFRAWTERSGHIKLEKRDVAKVTYHDFSDTPEFF